MMFNLATKIPTTLKAIIYELQKNQHIKYILVNFHLLFSCNF